MLTKKEKELFENELAGLDRVNYYKNVIDEEEKITKQVDNELRGLYYQLYTLEDKLMKAEYIADERNDISLAIYYGIMKRRIKTAMEAFDVAIECLEGHDTKIDTHRFA